MELQNPSPNVAELHKIRWSPDLLGSKIGKRFVGNKSIYPTVCSTDSEPQEIETNLNMLKNVVGRILLLEKNVKGSVGYFVSGRDKRKSIEDFYYFCVSSLCYSKTSKRWKVWSGKCTPSEGRIKKEASSVAFVFIGGVMHSNPTKLFAILDSLDLNLCLVKKRQLVGFEALML